MDETDLDPDERWPLRAPNRLALALFLGTTAVSAQNLYPNSDFDDVDGIAGWTLLVGDWRHDMMDSSECPASGSLFGRAVKTKWIEHELHMQGPCVHLAEPAVISVSFRYRGEMTSQSNLNNVSARTYPADDCSGQALETETVYFTDVDWTSYSDTLFVPADGSMRLEVSSYGTAPATVWVDEIRATVQRHLFLDDFDGGGTCRWSSSVE